MSGSLVVVGDTLLDVDTTGRATRLTPDAPVPVLEDPVEVARPGGAGLAAVLAARDGRDVVLVTAIGDDEPGRRLRGLLAAEPGLTVRTLPARGRTAVKHRIRAGDRSVVRLDSGDARLDVEAVPDDVGEVLSRAGAVLVADYGRGVTAAEGMRRLLEAAAGRRPLVWDPHPRGSRPVPGARLVTPNRDEAARLARREGLPDVLPDAPPEGPPDEPAAVRSPLGAVRREADALVAAWRAAAVVVTMGSGGALLSYGAGAPVAVPAPAVPAVDVCGAGDRFAATAAGSLADGAVTAEAVQAGVLAASRYVALCGPSSLSADGGTTRGSTDAWEVAERLRSRGGVLVATGGCFDLLHAGHVATLRAARRLGDALVVCVNSDASVRRLKGRDRPLVTAADRRRVLEAVEDVDAVVVFDEDTPEAVLRRLRPDVWAKGGDYAGSELPEAPVLQEWGGQAVVLPYLPGRSTSELVLAARTTVPSVTPGGTP